MKLKEIMESLRVFYCLLFVFILKQKDLCLYPIRKQPVENLKVELGRTLSIPKGIDGGTNLEQKGH